MKIPPLKNFEPVPLLLKVRGGLLRELLPFLVSAVLAAGVGPVAACTSVLVTRGASVDGSVMITYNCDDAGAFATLGITPAMDHKPGEMIEIGPRNPEDKKPRGEIPQVPHTYKVLSGLMNEFQLAMSETTFGGRPELENPQVLMEYHHLMMLGLQRARTAREAIQVMTQLADQYGYESEGETISVADTQEAWILEIVGTGPGGKGAVWAAGAHSRRAGFLSRQSVASGRDSPERSRELVVFRQRGKLRRQQGLVRSPFRPALPFLRCLLPGHALFAPDMRLAGLEHLAPCRALPEPLPRLPSLQARRPALPAVAAAGQKALCRRRFRPHPRPLRRHRSGHDQRD